jgi:hypothetical protein
MVDILHFNLVCHSNLTLTLTKESLVSHPYIKHYAKDTFSLNLRIIEMCVLNIVEHSICDSYPQMSLFVR